MFWWDVLVDSYFIVDVALNFRLAYWTKDGTLETRREEIRKIPTSSGQYGCTLISTAMYVVGAGNHYLRTWFVVDFVASIPVSLLHSLSANL